MVEQLSTCDGSAGGESGLGFRILALLSEAAKGTIQNSIIKNKIKLHTEYVLAEMNH